MIREAFNVPICVPIVVVVVLFSRRIMSGDLQPSPQALGTKATQGLSILKTKRVVTAPTTLNVSEWSLSRIGFARRAKSTNMLLFAAASWEGWVFDVHCTYAKSQNGIPRYIHVVVNSTDRLLLVEG